MYDRERIAEQVEAVGTQVNELRVLLWDKDAMFLAGLVRAAEESLLLVVNTLKDTNVPDSEL